MPSTTEKLLLVEAYWRHEARAAGPSALRSLLLLLSSLRLLLLWCRAPLLLL